VVEASDADDALQRLNRQQVDVVVSSSDLVGGAAFDLLRRVREAPELQALPVVCLSDDPNRMQSESPSGYAFDECLVKFDQEAILASVTRLAKALRSRQAEAEAVLG
jgi:CheY-like chemotaxis protein